MPTPSSDTALLSPSPDHESQSFHSTCPPEDVRMYASRSNSTDDSGRSEVIVEFPIASPTQQPTPPADEDSPRDDGPSRQNSRSKQMIDEEDGPVRDTPSPVSAVDDSADADQRASHHHHPVALTRGDEPANLLARLDRPFPKHRFQPNSTSSFLRNGSKFHGTQKSDRQVYDVQVEIKYVDMEESFLCGYLRIQGLIKDHPTLTTYFEGEIIGNKYTFQTRHAEWGSNEKVDMQHWGRFPAWRPLAKQAKRPDFSFKNYAQRENVFMRWKEYFLVPDHRVKTIYGASFEGFYYICFNQVSGDIDGIYFHSKSEKYQQLKLTHVPDHGCFGAVEFR